MCSRTKGVFKSKIMIERKSSYQRKSTYQDTLQEDYPDNGLESTTLTGKGKKRKNHTRLVFKSDPSS